MRCCPLRLLPCNDGFRLAPPRTVIGGEGATGRRTALRHLLRKAFLCQLMGEAADLDVCQYRCDDYPAVIGMVLKQSEQHAAELAGDAGGARDPHRISVRATGRRRCSKHLRPEGEGGAFVLIQPLLARRPARRLPLPGRAHRAGSRAVRRARSWRRHHSSGPGLAPLVETGEEQGLTHGAASSLPAMRHQSSSGGASFAMPSWRTSAAGTVERQAECLANASNGTRRGQLGLRGASSAIGSCCVSMAIPLQHDFR